MLNPEACGAREMQTPNPKQSAHELIDQLPDNVSWTELANEIESRASIELGLEDIAAGRVVDGDEVMDWIASWGTPDEKAPPTV